MNIDLIQGDCLHEMQNIPKNMRFMLEFLNEVEKLTELCDGEISHDNSGLNLHSVNGSACKSRKIKR